MGHFKFFERSFKPFYNWVINFNKRVIKLEEEYF